MRLLICGSRDVQLSEDELNETLELRGFLYDIDTIISGGARGPDTTAIEWARHRGVPLLIYTPDWKRYGNRAGLVRNKYMVDECDQCLAFWDGMSTGTKYTMEYAASHGKPVCIVYVEPNGLNIP